MRHHIIQQYIVLYRVPSPGGGPHARLAASTRGVVFYATPHFGNGIAALGWKLRYLPGALPAPSLARLTPGEL